MTRPWLIPIAAIGLAFAVASNGMIELAYLGNGDTGITGVTFDFLNGFLILNGLAGLAAGAAAGAIAGIVIVRVHPTRRLVRRSVPVLTGLSALIVWAPAGSWYVTKDVSDMMMYACVPSRPDCGPPVDPTPFILIAIAVVLYLVAATLYFFTARSLPPLSRLGRAALLLLAVLPVLNVLGLVGFVVVAFRHGSPRAELSTELSTDLGAEHGSLTP